MLMTKFQQAFPQCSSGLDTKHPSEKLFMVLTSGWWVVQFTGQAALSPTGYLAFDTVPSP